MGQAVFLAPAAQRCSGQRSPHVQDSTLRCPCFKILPALASAFPALLGSGCVCLKVRRSTPESDCEQTGGMGVRGLTQVPPVHGRSRWLCPRRQRVARHSLPRAQLESADCLPPHLSPAGRDRVREEGPAREPSPRACLPAGMGWSQGPRQRISDFHQRTGEAGSHSKASHSHWRYATASVLREAGVACKGHPRGDGGRC